MTTTINKARYWVGIGWLENMREDWEETAGDLLEIPACYCKHMKDVDLKREDQKPHVHLILAGHNTTTQKHMLAVFSLLNAPGKTAFNTCKAVINIRHMYDYLIHDTETARKQGKHLYAPEDRVCLNGFNIGLYEQITQEDKNEMLREMLDFIQDNCISNVSLFYELYKPLSDPRYFDVFKSYGGLIERMCKGNFHRNVTDRNK